VIRVDEPRGFTRGIRQDLGEQTTGVGWLRGHVSAKR
jgi:hypothetical protein